MNKLLYSSANLLSVIPFVGTAAERPQKSGCYNGNIETQSRTSSSALPLDDEILNYMTIDSLAFFSKMPHPFSKTEKRDSAIRMKPSVLATAKSIT